MQHMIQCQETRIICHLCQEQRKLLKYDSTFSAIFFAHEKVKLLN
jgi:hypothetical protein